MATGYQDWHTLTFIQEQSASLYYADVFRILSEDPVFTERTLIAVEGIYYAWNSITLSGDGQLVILGKVTLLGD